MIGLKMVDIPVRPDHAKHIIVSAAITSAVLMVGQPALIAIGVAAVVGGAYEIYQKVTGRGRGEWSDFGADLIGILMVSAPHLVEMYRGMCVF
jgi:hypothetical protein